jgi:hypothetical protein
MSGRPKGKPDRTSTVVAGGLVLLGVLGVATIFWGPLMALVEPSSAAEAEARPPSSEPATGASVMDGGSPSGQAQEQIGRGDAGPHS